MKIKKIISQHRRDFAAIYECEYCDFIYKGHGYDDSYFHNNVILQKSALNAKKQQHQTIDH